MTKDNALIIPFFRELSCGVRKQADCKDIAFQPVPPKRFYAAKVREHGFVTRYKLRQMVVCFGGL